MSGALAHFYDLQEILECPVYEISRLHSFCNNCSEKTRNNAPGERNSCSLCQTLFRNKEGGIGGILRKHFNGRLVQLHSSYVDQNRHIVGHERTFGNYNMHVYDIISFNQNVMSEKLINQRLINISPNIF